MNKVDTPLSGLVILEPRVFSDDRGWFLESWNERKLAELGIHAHFVQDNHSSSKRGVLRGLHYQVGKVQGKLVRCIVGDIFDVCVDVRRSSPTFGNWFGVELTAKNHRILWVPPGFAHGFLVRSEVAEVTYKVTDFWDQKSEQGLLWNDPKIGVDWQTSLKPILNQRDATFPRLEELPPDRLL